MSNFLNGENVLSPLKVRKITYNSGKVLFTIFRFVILLSIGYIIIYPLFYMIVTSLVSGDAFKNSTAVWIPRKFNIAENYKRAFECLDYFNTLGYTFKYEIVSAVLEICSCAIIGYGFARFEFKFKKLFTAILLLTILVPDMMLLIPRMINYSQMDFLGILGLFNKVTGVDLRLDITDTGFTMWIPSILGIGLRSGTLIYIYIQFFKGFPYELEEAAWVDGSGPFRTFLSIVIPSSSVVIITVSIFSLIWHWNDSLLSGMYLNHGEPIALKLTSFCTVMASKYFIEFRAGNPESASIVMAGCVLVVTPMLVFYCIVQRWFIASIDRVGITG